MNPGTLRESGWLELVGGCIQASGQATCHNNEYDYFVIDARLQHAVVGVAIVVDGGLIFLNILLSQNFTLKN